MKLAIVATHPVQYYAPWFRHLAKEGSLSFKVFYLWQPEDEGYFDPGFQQNITWDLPLLDGYESEVVPNTNPRPGTDRFAGLSNPSLSKRLRSFKPDAVLLLAYRYHSILPILLKNLLGGGTPLLFRGDSHRLVAEVGVQAAIRRKAISTLFRSFSAALYVGRANYDYFRHHGVPEQKLFFSPHCVDNERFFDTQESAISAAADWREELRIPEDHRVILFLGKFEQKKRPLDLLEAFQRSHLEKTTLLFVGGGPLEKQLLENADIVPHAQIVPFRNQSEIPATLAACDLLVLPSAGKYETWGLVVNEALCMGKAVIVSDQVGCAADLVLPGESGLVFSAKDALALSQCLEEALSDSERLLSWGSRGRQIINGYNYTAASQGLYDALNFVVKGTSHR